VLKLKDSVLLGLRGLMIPIPGFLWQPQVRGGARKTRAQLETLPDEHSVIQYFCVKELPRVGKPISAAHIAENLPLSLERITATLDDLESRMTFLYRNADGAVAWAYPVTVHKTPHCAVFDTGERINAA
jgi:hypothetical protein